MLAKYLNKLDKKGGKVYLGIFVILLFLFVGTFAIAQIAGQQQDLSNIKDKKFKYEFLDNGLIKIEKNGKTLGEFGFVFTGEQNGTQIKYKSEDFSWDWNVENTLVNVDGGVADAIADGTYYVTTITGTNNNQEFLLTTQLIINPKTLTKVKTTITNNLGDMTNTKFWYVNKIEQGIKIKSGNEEFTSSMDSENLNNLESRPQEIEIGNYGLNYGDLDSNNFSITDIYSGNGANLGYDDQSIVAIGLTKNEGVLANGETIELDPIIQDTGFKSPAVAVCAGCANPNNVKASDNVYMTTRFSDFELNLTNFSLLSSEGGNIPDNAYIQGMEIQLETRRDCVSGGFTINVSASGDNGITYKTSEPVMLVNNTLDTYFSWSPYFDARIQDEGGVGLIWNTSMLSNSNFKVRIKRVSECASLYIDHVRVSVGWTTPSITNITNTNLEEALTQGNLIYHLSYSDITPTINLNNLVIYVPFDINDSAGVLAYAGDYHPSSNEFPYQGLGRPIINSTCGIFGTGMCFNGFELGSGYIHSRYMLENFTIGAWVYKTTTDSNHTVISYEKNPNNPDWAMTVKDGNIMAIQFSYANGTVITCNDSTQVTQNVWEHYTGTKNSTALNMYRNGALVKSCPLDPNGILLHSPANYLDSLQEPFLDIGASWDNNSYYNGYGWNGSLDEIKIYNYALSEAEIASDMQSPVAAVEPNGKLATTWSMIKAYK